MSTESPSHFDIPTFLSRLTTAPGVYQMFDKTSTVIYVGKAKNLKKRVSSYFQKNLLDPKTQRLVTQIHHIEVTITPTEIEALLLENTLIKKHRPRYNIFFKDDKSYPYIHLSQSPFPKLSAVRVNKKTSGEYFGPYPSVGNMQNTLEMLYKTFLLRQCNDTFFQNRSRPCLQYQIKRCSAPCVGYISKELYALDIERVKWFLQGKNQQLLQQLTTQMTQQSEALAFEAAAHTRDQIQVLQKLQQQQIVDTQHAIDADIIAIAELAQVIAIQVMWVRNGQVLGNKTFFPTVSEPDTLPSILSAFITQFYTATLMYQTLPQEIITTLPITIEEGLEPYLLQHYHCSPLWKTEVRGIRRQWQQLATLNLTHALQSHCTKQQKLWEQFKEFTALFALPQIPQQIECFDISHTQGEATVASCVVFDRNGALRSAYRRFNIRHITQGDDYAAMTQALTRHLQRKLTNAHPLPEVILIDGGKGQLSAAQSALTALAITTITLIGVAKGPSRKPGLEQLWQIGQSTPIQLPEHSPALHLIQQIRDEAHRFAITGHRQQRGKARQQSLLKTIPGIGDKRRSALLNHFGGWQGIEQATVSELSKVPGISTQLAEHIHQWLRTMVK